MNDVSRSLSDVAATFHDNWIWICVTLCWQVIDLVGIFIPLRTCELRVGVASFKLPPFVFTYFYILAFLLPLFVKLAYLCTCIFNILHWVAPVTCIRCLWYSRPQCRHAMQAAGGRERNPISAEASIIQSRIRTEWRTPSTISIYSLVAHILYTENLKKSKNNRKSFLN